MTVGLFNQELYLCILPGASALLIPRYVLANAMWVPGRELCKSSPVRKKGRAPDPTSPHAMLFSRAYGLPTIGSIKIKSPLQRS